MYYKLIAIYLFLLLTGCKESYPQDYLMQHPDILKSEIARCRSMSEYTPYCDHIKQVLEDFTALEDVRNNDPELFGKQILQAQMELERAKTSLQQARQELQMLNTQHASAATVQAAKDKLVLIEQAYQAQSEKIKQFLAIVAVTSM